MKFPAQEEFCALSARLGREKSLIQGAGGNTSMKVEGTLWVKASGTWLSDADRENIFVGLNLEAARRRIAAGLGDSFPGMTVGGAQHLRPSIETALHALLPHRVVIHVHSVRTISLAVRQDATAVLARRLDGLKWAFVPYARPGIELADAVGAVLARQSCDVLVLGNHGLIVGAVDCSQAEARLADVEARLDGPVRDIVKPDIAALSALAEGTGYALPFHPEVHAIADPAMAGVLARGSLYPDHVVFLGHAVAIVADGCLPSATRSLLESPRLAIVPGKGALVQKGLSRNGEEMALALALVSGFLAVDTPLRYLSAAEEEALVDWGPEKYRQSLQK